MGFELLKLFAPLLEYPSPQLAEQVEACIAPLSLETPIAAEHLAVFRAGISGYSQGQMEELFTSTFDMQPVCYPYVGYQLFGESYKRGAFMAQLVEGYRACGFSSEAELPDHLAVVLRFLSLDAAVRESEFSQALLTEALLPSLEKMRLSLEGQVKNPYVEVFLALSLYLQRNLEKERAHA